MFSRKTAFVVFSFALAFAGCQHNLSPIRGRPLDGLQKMGTQSGVGNTRPITNGEAQPQLYVRKPELSVNERLDSEDGSLFNADDKRNFLIVPRDHLAEGSYIDVLVVYGRTEKTDGSKADTKKDPSAPTPEGLSEEEKKILAGLPNLEPADAKMVPIRTFKMQVIGRRPNGDYDLRYQRELINSQESYGLIITATLSHEKAIDPDSKRTTDLTNIEWAETRDGKVEFKRSPGWDDEYAFRMSGFSEIKSKEAIALDEKRTQLEQARKSIEQQLRQLGAERNSVAQTRATVAKNKQENESAVNNLQREIETKDKTIAEQRDEIENLRGESKPGAQKDAAGGK